jgi:hypothetical protein
MVSSAGSPMYMPAWARPTRSSGPPATTTPSPGAVRLAHNARAKDGVMTR